MYVSVKWVKTGSGKNLFGTMLSPELMLIYCQLDPKQTSMKFRSK